MSKKITLENVDSSELPEIPVIGEVKQIRFTQDMELVSTLADSDLFMVQVGADLEARPNTITFDLIIKNLSGPIEEGSKKFVTGDMMFKVIGDMNLLDTWDNTNIVSSLNATYVNVRRIEEELRREINRSTGKDEQHDEQIANLRQDLTSTNELLNQEINRSVAKDNEHDELLAGLRDDVDSTSDKLDAEIDRSTAKDAEHDTLLKGLRVDVNANKSAIESEVARSTARDEAHDEAIAKNASDITTEVNRAKAEEAKIRQEMQTADTNLQNAITAETERATGVEEDLQQQITDLSGSTDDRLEALEALSHEQNTDTGTTSKTFVIDSGNTGAMLKAEGGGLSTRTKGDAGYANFTVQNLVIKGDVTQEGDTFITQAERVEVRDNMILINEGETGAGVTAGFAGIEVDRGTEQNFMFGFNESDGMFKIGKEGNMFDVALRQPVGEMTDGMFASWDAATKTFKTTNLIPPTLQLYFGVPEVSVKYASDNNGSLQFVTNDKSWSVYTGVGSTKFTSSENRFRFYGEVNISDGVLKCDVNSFQIQVASANKLVISGSGSTLSTPLTANSFFRVSDNAEVLYATDITTLTDGMFLSWDADNKKVVTTNKLPIGKKLYIAYDHTYITEGGSDGIEFNTRDAWLRVSTGSVESRFVSSANWFLFEGNISTTGKIATTGTNLRLENKSNYLSIGNGASTMDTTLKATTFYRSSDNSEVLYQADLKSVLTGKETNYAPTVKAVSDAIDAVNTGTTDTLKNYLKLSGGTMTGSIRIVDAGSSSTLTGILNHDGSKALLFTYLKGSESRWGVGTKETVGIIRSNVSDLIHLVNNNGTLNEYSIYDKRNLPDPATKSGNNAFTGTNSFVANKFSVGSFKVDRNSSLEVNIPYKENVTAWERSLSFMYNSLEDTRVTFGSMISATAADYAYIRIGSSVAQYKFHTEDLDLNTKFRINFGNATAISADESTIIFGSNKRGCHVRSNDTDLVHIKNNNSYKILDESNYSQYLPTTSKWTYGFVHESKEVYDLNTDLVGPDKGKLAYNYTGPSYWTNGPTGMYYGTVIQIWGSGSPASTPSLMPQLAFDVNHNVANSTRYMYFRTANNLGYGDSSNWKRVVTADENVASLVMDVNTYPSIARIDGTTYTWLRTPTQGLLPNTQVTLENGGVSHLGTNDWSFQRAYIASVHASKYYFGSTGTYLSGDENYIGILNNGTAKGMKVGRLLVSSNYGNTPLVPTNGIFSSGKIQSNDSMLVGYTRNTADGQLGYGLYYAGASYIGLGSEYSSGAMILYKSVNPNIGSSGYNVPVAGTVTPCYLKLINGTLKLGVGANKAYTAGEAVTMTEYTLATLDAVNTKLGSYLPLTGGTISGSLTISPVGSAGFVVNNADTPGVDVTQTFRVKGANKFLFGWSESGGGAFIQRSDNNRCMVLMSDGLYTGSALDNTVRVATLTDLGSCATQSWVTSQGYLTSHQAIYALTFAAGAFAAKTFTPTSAAVTVNVPTKTSHLTNDSGFLTSVPSTYATQSWVTSQGYLTSITKSMVTTALGYTPPTTNTTYSQATSSTLGLVKIGATGLASKNYAVQLNSSGQMYVAVPWTDTNTTYSAATSSTYGLVKIGATGLASKNYAVQLNSSGQMYVAVPWTDTDTNTHYTTRLYAGASGTAANSATTSPYIKVTDDNTCRNQIRLLGGGATSVSSDASGNITITSTNTTYGLATASSNGLMSSSQYTKLSNCIETVSATNMVTSVQVVDTIPATSSQVTGRLYLKFA